MKLDFQQYTNAVVALLKSKPINLACLCRFQTEYPFKMQRNESGTRGERLGVFNLRLSRHLHPSCRD